MPKQLLFSITLKDCRVDTFSVGGHGGSGKDTSNTGVRVTHLASGAEGKGVRSRSQLENKRAAFIQMAETPRFRMWLKLEVAKRHGLRTVDQIVDEDMDPSNLKVEVRDPEGKWRVEDV